MDPSQLKQMTQNSLKKMKTFFFSNVQFQKIGLTDQFMIQQRQRMRLGVSHPKITMEQLGLTAIQQGNNLFNLVKQKKLQIIQVKSNSYSHAIIKIRAKKSTRFSLQAGTLLYPRNQKMGLTQSLMLKDDLDTQASQGESQFELDSFCYNQQYRAPGSQSYLLSSIKSLGYEDGMNQNEVWQITVRKKQIVQQLQKKVIQRQKYIALTKKQVYEMISMWED